ncbi:MAG: hypothetical protein V4526_01305 [Patescibacteria group bacterium]
MKSSWGFLEKIKDGRKTVESRWYLSKRAPWGRVKAGDKIFFKDSGKPVGLKATTDNVLQFENLTPSRVKEILHTYGSRIGIEKKDLTNFYNDLKDKKYCILVFLKNPQPVKPFNINKRGFGAMAAWMSVKNIRDIVC